MWLEHVHGYDLPDTGIPWVARFHDGYDEYTVMTVNPYQIFTPSDTAAMAVATVAVMSDPTLVNDNGWSFVDLTEHHIFSTPPATTSSVSAA